MILRALPPAIQTALLSATISSSVEAMGRSSRRDTVRVTIDAHAGGLASAEVGLIEVRDTLSHVAVSRQVSREAVKRLNDGRIKGKRFRATLVGAKRSR